MVVVGVFMGTLALIEIFMLWMFMDYRRKGEFCYQMTACGGVAIFLLVTLVFGIYKIFNNVVYTFGHFISVIDQVSDMLMLGLAPVMLVIAALLSISNISLMRHEGYRPVNALGILFGILWIICIALTMGVNYLPMGEVFRKYIRPPLLYTICYFGCMFLSTMASAYLASKYVPAFDRDYIIILGCAIRSDGSLTPLLKARADAALNFEKKQYDSTGKHAVFVPSGGQGSDEVISEGEAMERYLLSEGVPPERILREDKSVNTMENMRFSRDKITEVEGDSFEYRKISFATTNYHVFRGYILALKNGFKAEGISAKTKAYFYPNAFLREFVGLLVDQKFKHLLFIAIIIVLFTALSKAL